MHAQDPLCVGADTSVVSSAHKGGSDLDVRGRVYCTKRLCFKQLVASIAILRHSRHATVTNQELIPGHNTPRASDTTLTMNASQTAPSSPSETVCHQTASDAIRRCMQKSRTALDLQGELLKLNTNSYCLTTSLGQDYGDSFRSELQKITRDMKLPTVMRALIQDLHDTMSRSSNGSFDEQDDVLGRWIRDTRVSRRLDREQKEEEEAWVIVDPEAVSEHEPRV